MPGDDATALEPWIVEALVSALRSVGCPTDTARELAREARIDRPPHSSDEFLILLGGHGAGIALPILPGHVEEVIWSLAQNAAAENAEAHDQTARGDSDRASLWPLLDRPPRGT